jgi:hypothetical protein
LAQLMPVTAIPWFGEIDKTGVVVSIYFLTLAILTLVGRRYLEYHFKLET